MKSNMLVISDFHFHNYKQHSTQINGVNSRFLDVRDVWQEAIEIAKDNDCDVICICGDVFHVRGHLRPSVFNRVFDLFVEAAAEGFRFALIPGNHDMENYNGGATAIDALGHIEEQHGAKSVFVLKERGAHVGGWRILGIPYYHKTEDFKQAYEAQLSVGKADIILIHQGIDTFCSASGIPDTGLTAEYLAEKAPGAWIFAGHYHDPKQIAGSTVQQVVNVGAPLQHSFGDEGSVRGCWILRPDDTVQLVPLEAPQFVTFHAAGRWKKSIAEESKGNFVRIKADSLKRAEQWKERCLEGGALSVSIIIEKEYQSAHERPIKLSAPRKMLGEFVDKFPEYAAKKDQLLSLFDEVSA